VQNDLVKVLLVISVASVDTFAESVVISKKKNTMLKNKKGAVKSEANL